MNPSSAMAFVSAIPGLCCSVFSALEMASPLAAEQTSKTAMMVAANDPLNRIPLVILPDSMQYLLDLRTEPCGCWVIMLGASLARVRFVHSSKKRYWALVQCRTAAALGQ